MRHEKIFRNKDGSRTKVIATLCVHEFSLKHEYVCNAFWCAKGKRLWVNCQTAQERMQETKLELWQMLKPKD